MIRNSSAKEQRVKNKQLLTKRFQFDPNKLQKRKFRSIMSFATEESIKKTEFSSVKCQNIETMWNESSWLSKLVNGIEEDNTNFQQAKCQIGNKQFSEIDIINKLSSSISQGESLFKKKPELIKIEEQKPNKSKRDLKSKQSQNRKTLIQKDKQPQIQIRKNKRINANQLINKNDNASQSIKNKQSVCYDAHKTIKKKLNNNNDKGSNQNRQSRSKSKKIVKTHQYLKKSNNKTPLQQRNNNKLEIEQIKQFVFEQSQKISNISQITYKQNNSDYSNNKPVGVIKKNKINLLLIKQQPHKNYLKPISIQQTVKENQLTNSQKLKYDYDNRKMALNNNNTLGSGNLQLVKKHQSSFFTTKTGSGQPSTENTSRRRIYQSSIQDTNRQSDSFIQKVSKKLASMNQFKEHNEQFNEITQTFNKLNPNLQNELTRDNIYYNKQAQQIPLCYTPLINRIRYERQKFSYNEFYQQAQKIKRNIKYPQIQSQQKVNPVNKVQYNSQYKKRQPYKYNYNLAQIKQEEQKEAKYREYLNHIEFTQQQFVLSQFQNITIDGRNINHKQTQIMEQNQIQLTKYPYLDSINLTQTQILNFTQQQQSNYNPKKQNIWTVQNILQKMNNTNKNNKKCLQTINENILQHSQNNNSLNSEQFGVLQKLSLKLDRYIETHQLEETYQKFQLSFNQLKKNR